MSWREKAFRYKKQTILVRCGFLFYNASHVNIFPLLPPKYTTYYNTWHVGISMWIWIEQQGTRPERSVTREVSFCMPHLRNETCMCHSGTETLLFTYHSQKYNSYVCRIDHQNKITSNSNLSVFRFESEWRNHSAANLTLYYRTPIFHGY
jgi:hypothetical protein